MKFGSRSWGCVVCALLAAWGLHAFLKAREYARGLQELEQRLASLQPPPAVPMREFPSRRSEPLFFTNLVTQAKPEAGRAPAVLLSNLVLQATAGVKDSATARRFVQKLENLIDQGPPVLPPTRAFLRRFLDVELAYSRNTRFLIREGRTQVNGLLGPTLRLNLFEAVHRIGGPEAVDILAENLAATSLPFELLYLASLLDDLAPGKYRAMALAAARELLLHPSGEKVGFGIERYQREYLLSFLSSRQDPTLIAYAKEHMVNPEGRLDRNLLRHLEIAEGPDFMDTLENAFRDPRVADLSDRREILEEAVERVGREPQARNLLTRVLADNTVPLKLKEYAVRDFDDEGINQRNPSPADIPVIQERMMFLESSLPSIHDPNLVKTMDSIHKNLQKSLATAYRNQEKARAQP